MNVEWASQQNHGCSGVHSSSLRLCKIQPQPKLQTSCSGPLFWRHNQKLLLAIWRPLPPVYSCRLFWLHRESPTTSSLSSQEGLSAEKSLLPQQALPPCFSDTSAVATHYTPQGSQATLALLMKTYQAINSLYKAKLLLASSTYRGPALCWLSLVYWQSSPLP